MLNAKLVAGILVTIPLCLASMEAATAPEEPQACLQ